MRIALVGSSSYIAGYLVERLQNEHTVDSVIKIGRSGEFDEFLDLQSPESFNYSILDSVDVVVFTAAVSGPDKCASDFEMCWSINVIGTEYFIKQAIERKCRVLFFSSDAVYGDIPGFIYDETSKTNANTPYGRMKKAVEDEFFNVPEFKSLRLSYVVSARDKFVKYCLNCIKKQETAEIYHPFYRNCISVSDVEDAVLWMLTNWHSYQPHTLNVAGKELVSRVRIADEINRLLDNQLKYIIVKPEKEFYKNRPQITQMRSCYIRKYDIMEDNTFSEKIKKELKEIKI